MWVAGALEGSPRKLLILGLVGTGRFELPNALVLNELASPRTRSFGAFATRLRFNLGLLAVGFWNLGETTTDGRD